MSRTCVGARPGRRPWAIAWSSSDSPSRTEPSAARAISASASALDRRRPPARRCSAKCATSTSVVDPAQVEALAARQHGHRHLADLGGGEDELHVLGRLLQRLQQRVEGVLRQHVHFVDDVDLVARRDRPVAHAVDASRGCRRRRCGWRRPSPSRRHGGPRRWRRSASQTPQGSTVGPPLPSGPMQLSARAMIRAVVVLPTPRTPVSMKACGDAAGGDGVGQRAHQRVLADQLGEVCRPVLARQHAIGRRRRRLRRAGIGRTSLDPVLALAVIGLPRDRGGRLDERPGPKLVTAASFRT